MDVEQKKLKELLVQLLQRDSSSITNSLAGDSREKESFFNSSNNSFVNSSGESTTQPSDIRCEAHNCKYNENKECYAENVQIDQVNAYCNSFEYGENCTIWHL